MITLTSNITCSTSNSASVSVNSLAQRHKLTSDNIDLAWKFNHWNDLNNKKKLYCDFCDVPITGVIRRARSHQLGIRDDVASCRKTPADVKALLQADLDERTKGGYKEMMRLKCN